MLSDAASFAAFFKIVQEVSSPRFTDGCGISKKRINYMNAIKIFPNIIKWTVIMKIGPVLPLTFRQTSGVKLS